jgi:hypothetical protein
MRNAPHGNGALAVDDRAEVQDSTVAPAPDNPCWLCLHGEPDNRWGLCHHCLAAFFRQLRRRREAANRMAPLGDGRRDPAGRATDGRWTG